MISHTNINKQINPAHKRAYKGREPPPGASATREGEGEGQGWECQRGESQKGKGERGWGGLPAVPRERDIRENVEIIRRNWPCCVLGRDASYEFLLSFIWRFFSLLFVSANRRLDNFFIYLFLYLLPVSTKRFYYYYSSFPVSQFLNINIIHNKNSGRGRE